MGFVFSMATIAGIISSNVYPERTAPRYFQGHGIAMGFAFLAIICTTILTIANRIENARRDTLYGPAAVDGSDTNPNEVLTPEQLRAWGFEGLSKTQIIELGDKHPGTLSSCPILLNPSFQTAQHVLPIFLCPSSVPICCLILLFTFPSSLCSCAGAASCNVHLLPLCGIVVLSFFSPGRLKGCTLSTRIINTATLEPSTETWPA